MKIRAVLLDMGGVLLELGNYALPTGRADFRGREALLRMIRRRGGRASMDDLDRLMFEPWHEEYARRYDRGKEAIWNPHVSRLRKKARFRAWTKTVLKEWFEPYAEQIEPVPGARDAVEELERRGLKLALISNVPLPGVLYVPVLESFGLASAFSTMHFSYDEGHRKPSPAMLRSALAIMGVSPGEAVMVGDRRASDVAAGRTAGTLTVWVKSDHGGGPRADYTVRSVAEVVGVVEKIGV